MDPTVVAAWIAAGVSVQTLVGTLAAQYFGSRATRRAGQDIWQPPLAISLNFLSTIFVFVLSCAFYVKLAPRRLIARFSRAA
jgi:hypothetical protein